MLIDRISKWWALAELDDGSRIPLIGKYLGLSLVRNPGAAFGLFPGATVVIFFASLSVVTAAIVWGWRHPELHGRLGMVIGGGLANLIDRLIEPPGPIRGEVIDFIDSSFWPTFNLADSAIVVGVGLLLLSSRVDKEKPLDQASDSR